MKRISRNYKATSLGQFIYYVFPLKTCSDILHSYDSDSSDFCYVISAFKLRGDYIYFSHCENRVSRIYMEINLRSKLVLDNWEVLRRFFKSVFFNGGRKLAKELFPINLPLDNKSIIIEKIILDEELTVILSIRDCRYNLTARYDSETRLYITLCEELEDHHQYMIYQEFCNKGQAEKVERDLSRIIIDGDEISE